MKKSRSTVLLASVIEDDRDAAKPLAQARPVAMHFPSRYVPLTAIILATCTLASTIFSNRYHQHDIGGIPWPYISDTAKDAPQAGLFSYGMTVVSVLLVAVVVLHYGKLKNDLALVNDKVGAKRNRWSLLCGLVAAPNLGLLACYDTLRTPGLHMVFVLGFFPAAVVYLFAVTSIYGLLVRDAGKKVDNAPTVAHQRQRWLSLSASLWWKRQICRVFSVAVSLYLPIGMVLVSNWYDYAADWQVHTMRAMTQHVSVLCLLSFFGTCYLDFGEINFFIVQG